MEKQMCVNRLPIPYELLIIIKEFAFYDWIQYHAIYRKKIVLNLIKNTPDTFKNKITQICFKFWIEQDPRCKQFQMLFCSKCGNYIRNQSNNDHKKIQCKCLF